MKASTALNTFGLLLLAGCFVIATIGVFKRDAAERDYEALNPGVKIEQMLIPEKFYANWVTTQLIGGTAPDLIQINTNTLDAARIARFFAPLGAAIAEPNPHNAGTALEGQP